MAEIVLGMATSHGPMLSTPPENWDLRIPDDKRSIHHFQGRTWTFDELVAERASEGLRAQITLEKWRERHARCRSAIEELATVFEQAAPDVAIIVGNDQMEIFDDTLLPALSVLWGDEIVNSMYTDERMAKLPPGIPISVPGHIPPGGAKYPAQSALAQEVIAQAMADGFDVASMKRMPKGETPHAFGFVFRQIMRDSAVPTVPVVINTFYPPNQPTVQRCYDFGKTIARAVAAWDSPARVALIASGGLTHFVIDEDIDQVVLAALREKNIGSVAGLGERIFQAGTSEIKNWLPVAGAMASLNLSPTLVDYVPCYRTMAGTGNAMGFVYWSQEEIDRSK